MAKLTSLKGTNTLAYLFEHKLRKNFITLANEKMGFTKQINYKLITIIIWVVGPYLFPNQVILSHPFVAKAPIPKMMSKSVMLWSHIFGDTIW